MEAQSRPPPPPPPPPPPLTVIGYPATMYHSAPSNMAYPYNNPNAIHPSPRISSLRRLIIILICVFVFFVAVSFIFWIFLRPRLPEFRVDSVTVSNLTVSSSQVTGNWDFRFSIRNPNNKMSTYYDRIDSLLYYKSAFLSETAVAPFVQGTNNQTVVSASFASRGYYVEDWVVNDINDDKRVGIVGFDVMLLAKAWVTNGVWRVRRPMLRVSCKNVKVKLSSSSDGGSSGTLLSGNWKCNVAM